MPEPCCAFTKQDGTPCAARPLPGRPFCLFHDPDQTDRLTEARRKGGATPRRRLRRYPRLLDRYHIAELLSELFMTAVNAPDSVDSKNLQAITNLARTLLKAVGAPGDKYLEHNPRTEPDAASDHLLRVYPLLPPDVEALLAAEQPAPELASAPSHPPSAAATPPEEPHTPAPYTPSPDPSDPPDHLPLPQDDEQAPNRCGTGDPDTDGFAPVNPCPPTPESQNARSPEPLTPEQDPEQDWSRWGTGPSATDESDRSVPSAGDPPPTGQIPAAAQPLDPSAAEDLSEPEPRHILVDPHAPWPGPYRPTPGHVIVDLPFNPTGQRFR